MGGFGGWWGGCIAWGVCLEWFGGWVWQFDGFREVGWVFRDHFLGFFIMILMAAALLCCVHCWDMQSLFFEKFRRCAIDVGFV